MTLTDLLSPAAVISPLRANGKKQALQELALHAASLTGLSEREIFEALLQRERLGSTGIGDGIAIPHWKLTNLTEIISGFGLSKSGIEFDSLDGKPAHLFFLLIAPDNSVGTHLKMLARISRMLKNSSFRTKLMNATSQKEIYQIIAEEDVKY